MLTASGAKLLDFGLAKFRRTVLVTIRLASLDQLPQRFGDFAGFLFFTTYSGGQARSGTEPPCTSGFRTASLTTRCFSVAIVLRLLLSRPFLFT